LFSAENNDIYGQTQVLGENNRKLEQSSAFPNTIFPRIVFLTIRNAVRWRNRRWLQQHDKSL